MSQWHSKRRYYRRGFLEQSWQTNRPGCGKHSGRYLFLVLGGSLLARGLRYRAKLKNILGDFGNRPGVWSNLL
jgi:hypothetical protein